jgi:thiamine kinase
MITLQQALAAIPEISSATVEQQLSDGPSNASYLLEQSGERFVLRLDKPEARALGLNRSNEKTVLQAIANGGLAAEPYYFDVSKGVLLRSFIAGRSWTMDDMGRQHQLSRLARLLRTLHGLPPAGDSFDPLKAAHGYARFINDSGANAVLRRAENLATEIGNFPQSAVLCHNDLVCQNILESESLRLIDWEYAAVGDRFFDLAVVLQHHGVESRLSGVFLENYLGRSALAEEQKQLSLQRDFYQCLLDLWNLRTACVR